MGLGREQDDDHAGSHIQVGHAPPPPAMDVWTLLDQLVEKLELE